MTLLSDRARPAVLLAAIAAIVGAMVWCVAVTLNGRVGVVTVLDEPIGSEVVLSLVRVCSIDGPEAWTVGNAALRIPVVGPTGTLTVGEEVTIGGIVGDGFVAVRWIENAPDRPAKYRLGLVGLAVAGTVFLGSVRLGRRGLTLRG